MKLREGLNRIKPIMVFVSLLVIVMIVNAANINFNLMYPEQPSIYLINQSIHHFSDLLNIYLHPKLLNQNIPFFRPSGHFLIYQLITPLLGWHNTKAFLILNFVFLALIGYLFIELYQMLFPRFKVGGYLGFSFYLMHPGLSLARITIMHFEFAYVFFLLVSLNLFIKFCQNNAAENAIQKIKFHSLSLFITSLLLYVVAMTFKEPAIMLGPVMMSYFWIYFYNKQSVFKYFFAMVLNRQALLIMTMITSVSLLLGLYLIASWPSIKYTNTFLNLDHTYGTINSFFIDIIGFKHDIINRGTLPAPDLAWRTTIYPFSVRLILWPFFILSIFSSIFLFSKKSANQLIFQKSLAFSYISAFLFMIIPLVWGGGGPWHYSLTLICMGLILGFCLEYTCSLFNLRSFWKIAICLSIACINCIIATQVNELNIKKYFTIEDGKIGLAVNRNAILNPPNIKNKLTPNSLIVVEDSSIHNDYLLGNAAYPFLLFFGNNEYDALMEIQSRFFLQFHHTYSGKLFRYAYLMPTIKEELYPFHVENMNVISNEIIYNWLIHYNDIFCLGYDQDGNWHDKTILFKQQLLKIETERELIIHQYKTTPVTASSNNVSHIENIPYPDAQLCQYKCDQDTACKGFVYEYSVKDNHSTIQCRYSDKSYVAGKQDCNNCLWYKKNELSNHFAKVGNPSLSPTA